MFYGFHCSPFTSLDKLIPKYFILCDAAVDRIAFLISFSEGASLADWNALVLYSGLYLYFTDSVY